MPRILPKGADLVSPRYIAAKFPSEADTSPTFPVQLNKTDRAHLVIGFESSVVSITGIEVSYTPYSILIVLDEGNVV